MSKLMHEPCGCTHDGGAWLKLCPEHRAEADAQHERARRDHEHYMIGFNKALESAIPCDDPAAYRLEDTESELIDETSSEDCDPLLE